MKDNSLNNTKDKDQLNKDDKNKKNKLYSNVLTKKERKFRFRILDIIFIVIALGLSCVFFIKPSTYAGKEKKLLIFAGDEKIQIPFVDQKINFQNDFYDVNFQKHNIHKNIVMEVKNKRAHVISSDCPDKVCIHMGWAENCGNVIICMPNSFGVLVDCSENNNENK